MLAQQRVEVTTVGIVTGEELRIAAPQAGQIGKLHYAEHETFEQNSVIADLDNIALQSTIDALQIETKSLEDLIAEVESQPVSDPARDLMRDIERYRLELSQAQGRLRVAQLAIDAASATVDMKLAAVQRAEHLASQSALTPSELSVRQDELRLAMLELKRAKLERDVESESVRDINAAIERTQQTIAQTQKTLPDTVSLRARLEEKRTELKEAETKQKELSIRAEREGVIVHMLKHKGELVAEGETICIAVVGSNRWIRADFDPIDAEHLSPDMPVEILTSLGTGRRYDGIIRSIAPRVEVDATSASTFMPARRSTTVIIDPQGQPWNGLIPGQQVTCMVPIDRNFFSWTK